MALCQTLFVAKVNAYIKKTSGATLGSVNGSITSSKMFLTWFRFFTILLTVCVFTSLLFYLLKLLFPFSYQICFALISGLLVTFHLKCPLLFSVILIEFSVMCIIYVLSRLSFRGISFFVLKSAFVILLSTIQTINSERTHVHILIFFRLRHKKLSNSELVFELCWVFQIT